MNVPLNEFKINNKESTKTPPEVALASLLLTLNTFMYHLIQRFSDVLWRYRKRPIAWNQLRCFSQQLWAYICQLTTLTILSKQTLPYLLLEPVRQKRIGTAQKNEVFHLGFLQLMWPNRSFPAFGLKYGEIQSFSPKPQFSCIRTEFGEILCISPYSSPNAGKLRIWSHSLKKSLMENLIFFVQCGRNSFRI